MEILVYPDAKIASEAAADRLAHWLTAPGTKTFIAAAGNSPLELYRLIAERGLKLFDLHVFALDEYVGVPLDEPRNCANLLRRTVADAWGLSVDRFHTVSSLRYDAPAGIREHESKISALGGTDVIVLGLGRNGHLGFNEPGSEPNSVGRVLDLEPVSVEANTLWFGGDFVPSQGVTLGLRTILAARHILVVAFGSHKADVMGKAACGKEDLGCPASFLQRCHNVEFYVDAAAAKNVGTHFRKKLQS